MGVTVSESGVLLGGGRQCERVRCTAVVVDALAIGVTAHSKVVLNPVPTTHADGARFRRSTHQPDPEELHVSRVAHTQQAFGIRWLYAEHKLTCAGGTGVKARSREADG
jgi:hypothetical protein